MDFETYDVYRGKGVGYYWAFGVGLTLFVMSITIGFTVIEYCTQSHISAEVYEEAAQGLQWTRRFKKYTLWFRVAPNYFIKNAKLIWHRISGRQAQEYGVTRRSLEWTEEMKRPRYRYLQVEDPERSILRGSGEVFRMDNLLLPPSHTLPSPRARSSQSSEGNDSEWTHSSEGRIDNR